MKRTNRLKWAGWLAAAIAVAAAAGCGTAHAVETGARVRVMGATSLTPFLTSVAGRYQRAHPSGPSVHVAPGGSLAGLQQLRRGAVDIAASDLPPAALAGPWPKPVAGVVLGRLPVVLVVHPGVGVAGVTSAEAVRLFTGRVASWQELGGADEKVVVVARAPGSGARWVVQQRLLHGHPFWDRAVVQWSNGAVLRTVASTPGAVGFLDAGFVRPTVIVLALDGRRYAPDLAGAWPLNATAGLYWIRGARPEAAAFAHFAARQPDRARFGIEGDAHDVGGSQGERGPMVGGPGPP